ncbi:major capsid protein [Chelatococcus sp. XZ-Ab1]|uniref:major capsid protein n=1 Tax=Chelatococcus sp. XZ-Ab1 TaxID=3034027 RepID=UPI0023E39395|nr:major capsid protein [Chelatococcus sp. XZ-Ab1]
MLDIFNDDAFSVTNLTDAINEISFVPGRIGQMGLFEVNSVDTTTIAIEKKGDILVLVPPTPRGGPGTTVDKEKRDLRSLIIPHFEINDAIYAEEVQNVRAFGQERALQTVIQKVAQRQRTHVNSMSATEEFARIGAVKGVVTYADGSTLNLFQEFGVTQEPEIDFDLDNASPAGGALRKKCAGVIRQMAGILGGIPFSGLHAFCGDAFFDDLIAHKEVRDTYMNWQAAQELRQSYVSGGMSYGAFPFGGIMWENYRGKVGNQDFIEPDKCHIFPTGVPGLFKTVYAPADYEETVNTMGRRLYSRQYPMPNGKGRNLDVQTNALQYCTRPKTLLKGKRT